MVDTSKLQIKHIHASTPVSLYVFCHSTESFTLYPHPRPLTTSHNSTSILGPTHAYTFQ